MQRKLFVAGYITIPVYFPVDTINKELALKQVSEVLNNRSILTLDADINTIDGRSYPLIASRVLIEWTDTISEDDLI